MQAQTVTLQNAFVIQGVYTVPSHNCAGYLIGPKVFIKIQKMYLKEIKSTHSMLSHIDQLQDMEIYNLLDMSIEK